MEYAAFVNRLNARLDELKWLYCELYRNDVRAFEYFVDMLRRSYDDRKQALRDRDERRLADPDWYRSNKMLGMMLYVDNFAGDLKGVRAKLPYLKECGVNYLHLMPLLRTVKGRSDGGYAVADFRAVQPELGMMEDLERLADDCREAGISLALDFVMNHTSEDHTWARAARAGDPVARARYFFYDDRRIPDEFEKTVPQVFPTTAPGNFTWLDDCGQWVMTSFYPYQWDLNYANPMVFNDMTENLLYLTNRGMDVIRLDAIPYIWKQLGTDCRNLPQVHTLSRMLRLACEIVCPGVLLLGEVVMEPKKVAPYFGTPEKPECHMLYNVTTMCSTWSCLATRHRLGSGLRLAAAVRHGGSGAQEISQRLVYRQVAGQSRPRRALQRRPAPGRRQALRHDSLPLRGRGRGEGRRGLRSDAPCLDADPERDPRPLQRGRDRPAQRLRLPRGPGPGRGQPLPPPRTVQLGRRGTARRPEDPAGQALRRSAPVGDDPCEGGRLCRRRGIRRL